MASPASSFPRRPAVRRTAASLPVSRAAALLLTAILTAGHGHAISGASPDQRRHGLESVGASIQIPPGSIAELTGSGDSASLAIIDGSPEPSWSMRMQVMTSTLPEPVPGRQIRTLIDARQAAGGRVTILADEAFIASGMPGHLGWLLQTSDDGFSIALGWYCVAIGPREFVVLSAQAIPDNLDAIRPKLDAAARTLQVRPTEELVRERREGLARGEGFLRSLTPARLRQKVGFDQWYRVYHPGGGAGREQELGVIRLTTLAAPLGAVNPQRDPANYLPHEHVEGFAVRVQTRFHDRESSTNVDSEALYWMAWDSSEESWSLRATQRLGPRSRSEAITGIRTASSPADPRGTLIVVSTGMGQRESSRWERAVPDIYCPQPVRWLLGFLLPRMDEPLDLAFYSVEHIQGDHTIALRRDTWAPVAGRDGRWLHTSTPRPGEPVTKSLHDERGHLIRRELPDGSIMEPVDLARLRELWRRAGIPLSGGG